MTNGSRHRRYNTTRLATNSLERGLAVMRAIGQRRGGMTNTEVSREMDIPKSTCTYILTRLEREGYVCRSKITGRYRVGLKALALAHDALREIGFHTMAEPVLYRLASTTGLVAVVGALEGGQVLTIDRVESPEFMEVGQSTWPYYPSREHRDLGAELSLHASSVGRVLLAYMPRDEAREILQSIQLTKLGPQTITGTSELWAELERIREQGFAIADQQLHEDFCAIGAPIFDAKGAVRAAVSLAGSREMPVFRDLSGLVGVVKGGARELSRRLALPLKEWDLQSFLAEGAQGFAKRAAELGGWASDN